MINEIKTNHSLKDDLLIEEPNDCITKSMSFSDAIRIHASSIHKTFTRDNQSYTIIVPFDHQLNLYIIKEEDVTENKEYIYDTLGNLNTCLTSEKSYIPTVVLILLGLFYLILVFILLYVSLIISILCLYNPCILIVLAYLIIQVIFITFVHMYYRVRDYYKQNKFLKMLSEESKQSKEKYKIEWSYGKDGSWMEITKSL